jgi:hypothetical protein
MIEGQIAIAKRMNIAHMLDQFLTRIFSSWLVFAILAFAHADQMPDPLSTVRLATAKMPG